MKPLSKEASAALSALKAVDPTDADEARVRAGLEKTLGLAVPVAAATTGAKAAAVAAKGLTGLTVGGKVFLVVATASVLATSAAVIRANAPEAPIVRRVPAATIPDPVNPGPNPVQPSPVQPERSRGDDEALQAEAITSPSPEESPLPRPATADPARRPAALPAPEARRPVEPVAAAEPEPLAEPPAPPPTIEAQVETDFPGCDADTERRVATSARAFLTAVRPADAVALLSEYQRRCPSGRWSDEAWSVRLESLCRLRRDADVIGLMQWFSADYPQRRAAMAERLTDACSEDVLRRGFAAPR